MFEMRGHGIYIPWWAKVLIFPFELLEKIKGKKFK
jgi:hypothetical protein